MPAFRVHFDPRGGKTRDPFLVEAADPSAAIAMARKACPDWTVKKIKRDRAASASERRRA